MRQGATAITGQAYISSYFVLRTYVDFSKDTIEVCIVYSWGDVYICVIVIGKCT